MKQLTTIFLLLIAFTGCTPKEKPITKANEPIIEKNKIALVYTSAHSTNLKLTLTDTLVFNDFKQPLETESAILVDPSKEFQTFMGIGAALTDASAETFYKLSKENQDRFMESYFSVGKGIGYTLARTIIHSCDFSSASYTYIEEGDAELKTFNIDHDKQFRLPFTKLAIAA
ncbi:MAG: glycosyl hydrolase, partial [Lutibacter sp.]